MSGIEGALLELQPLQLVARVCGQLAKLAVP